MNRLSQPCRDRPYLDALIKRSIAEFEALPPEQKRAGLHAQCKSWVIGELMLSHPDMTREQAEARYEHAIHYRGPPTPILDALLHSYRMKVRELALREAVRTYIKGRGRWSYRSYGGEVTLSALSVNDIAAKTARRARELFDGE